MGKVNELSMLVDELKKCGETLIGLSEGLADLFSGSAEEEKLSEVNPAEYKALLAEVEVLGNAG